MRSDIYFPNQNEHNVATLSLALNAYRTSLVKGFELKLKDRQYKHLFHRADNKFKPQNSFFFGD